MLLFPYLKEDRRKAGTLQQREFESTLQLGVRNGLFSPPQFPELPGKFPFHIAICAVSLPDGCIPPSKSLRTRISSGLGETREKAAFKALAEAAERYSLQYSPGRPDQVSPIFAVGGTAESAGIGELTLGGPPQVKAITSVGCASGLDIDDASSRAALEVIEHLRLQAFHGDRGDFFKVNLAAIADLGPHRRFLSSQLRRLDAWLEIVAENHFVAVATCSDMDGGRLSIGSAAGTDCTAAIRKAGEDAIFQWRNMVELERRGVDLTEFDGAEAQVVRLFRGATPRRHWTASLQAREADLPEPLKRERTDPLIALASLAEKRVRVFDLSAAALGIPVTRVVLD